RGGVQGGERGSDERDARERRWAAVPLRPSGHGARSPKSTPGHVSVPAVHGGRGADVAQRGSRRHLSTYCLFRRQDPEKGPAGGSSGGATDQVRPGDQHEGGESAWLDGSARAAAAGGSGDRLTEATMERTLIANTTIFDGSGAAPFSGDVL